MRELDYKKLRKAITFGIFNCLVLVCTLYLLANSLTHGDFVMAGVLLAMYIFFLVT